MSDPLPSAPETIWTAGNIIAASALVVSLAAIAIAAVAAYFQWLTTSAQLITSFANRYDSPEMRKCRKNLAAQLLSPTKRKQIDLTHCDLVLDLFEELGYLTRRKVLFKGMVWNHFFDRFERYYRAITEPSNLLQSARTKRNSDGIYKEIDWLIKKLRKIDRKEGGYIPPSNSDIQEFLLSESSLQIGKS